MTSPREPGAGKSALRERILARRLARPEPERAAAAASIAATLLKVLATVRAFAAYVPEELEPGYGRLPAVHTQLDARVLLPVAPSSGAELAWAVDTGRLAPGRFGMLEPVGPRLGPTAIGTADVVVVPALAVDRAGVRLGRGQGLYDRALTHTREGALIVAVVFDDELVDEVPSEAHDHHVHAVVTPSGGWQALPVGH